MEVLEGIHFLLWAKTAVIESSIYEKCEISKTVEKSESTWSMHFIKPYTWLNI